MTDMLRFDTDQIAQLGAATLGHQQQWDEIWNRVRSGLSATAAEALSQEPGGSLEQRTADYHRRTQLYNEQLRTQSSAVRRVGETATAYNQRMAQVIAGR